MKVFTNGGEEEVIVGEIPPKSMANPDYGVVVRPYAFGQYRIQLTHGKPDPFAPMGHGRIVMEC